MRGRLLAAVLLFLAHQAHADDPAPRPGEVRLYLRDGRNVLGVVVERSEEEYVLETPSGERVRVPAALIREVVHVGPDVESSARPDLDPARYRYLTAPSALPLPRGAFFLSGAQPSQVFVSYGILDVLTATVGSSFPTSYLRVYGGNAVARLQAGWSFLPWLHAQAGLELQVWSLRRVAFLSGAVTFGSPALHATLHGGPSPFGAARQGFGDTSLAVSGLARVHRGVAIVSENWIDRNGKSGAVNALAARLYSQRLSADIGVVRLPRGGAMPWVGVSLTPVAKRELDL